MPYIRVRKWTLFRGLLCTTALVTALLPRFLFSETSSADLDPSIVGTDSSEKPASTGHDYYLAINPGVVVVGEDLVITRNETETVKSIGELDGGLRVSWHLDLTTADLRLGRYAGFHVLAWAGSMSLAPLSVCSPVSVASSASQAFWALMEPSSWM